MNLVHGSIDYYIELRKIRLETEMVDRANGRVDPYPADSEDDPDARLARAFVVGARVKDAYGLHGTIDSTLQPSSEFHGPYHWVQWDDPSLGADYRRINPRCRAGFRMGMQTSEIFLVKEST